MSKRTIDIEHLELRLRGTPAASARATAERVGRELLGQLAVVNRAPGALRGGRVEQLDMGQVRLASGTRPQELGRVIATRIAGALRGPSK